MPRYVLEITGKTACGCESRLEFDYAEGVDPHPGDAGAVLAAALDPDVSNMRDFLMDERHANAGYEKVTVTAQVKVR